MHLEPECLPCLLSQVVRAGRMMEQNTHDIITLTHDVCTLMASFPEEYSTPEAAAKIYEKIRTLGNGNDPYAAIKKDSTERALALYPHLKQIVNDADDPLAMAIRVAITGNVIDYGTGADIHLDEAVEHAMERECARWDYDSFVRLLDGADHVLYLGDNAGETVFDRVLIETLGKPVTYAVRDVPVINDATMDDAIVAGLPEVATVISSGTTAPGTVLSLCEPSFVEMFHCVPLIISKGQGNYEALAEEKGPLFFLLKVKCPVIARRFTIDMGESVLAHAEELR